MELNQEIERSDTNEVEHNVQPISVLPHEMILSILSFCDHRSLLNAMTISEVWRDCGEYILQKATYWKNLCRNDIAKSSFLQYLSKETHNELVYERVYLKWSQWHDMKKCSTCKDDLDVHKPAQCPAHPVAISNDRGIVRNRQVLGYIIAFDHKIKYYFSKDVIIKCCNVGEEQLFLVFTMISAQNFLYNVLVRDFLPSQISNFYYYGDILVLGLQNGNVLVYFVDKWDTFTLASYVKKFVGIRGRIRNIGLKERGRKRIIAVEAARRVYTFTWLVKHRC